MIYKAVILLASIIVILLFSLVFIRSDDYVSDKAEKWNWYVYGILTMCVLSMIILISVIGGMNNGISNESDKYQETIKIDSNKMNDSVNF